MPRPALALVVVSLCFPALGAFPADLLAVTSSAKVALHVKSHATKSSAICQQSAPTTIPCSQYTSTGDIGTGYDVYVVVGDADSSGVAGLTFGIDYDGTPAVGVDVVGSWTLCTTGLEFPSSNWPGAGAGNVITWNTADCGRILLPPNGNHGIGGAFYVFAYSPDTFSITPHLLQQGGPNLEMANCEGQSMDLIPTNVGVASFGGGAGYNPCAESTGNPVCSLSQSTLDFGNVPLGSSRTLSFQITNTGGPESFLTGLIFEDCDAFEVVSGGGSYLLGAGQTRSVSIRFSPDLIQPYACSVDLGTGCPPVELAGVGGPPPDISVSPTSLSASLTTGQSSMQLLSIKNSGAGTLTWGASGLTNFVSIDPPPNGNLSPGSSRDLKVVFDAVGISAGQYFTEILIQSNDPDEPVVSIPTQLTVTGLPDLVLSGYGLESSMDFGSGVHETKHAFASPGVPPGGTATLEVLVEGNFRSTAQRALVYAEGTELGELGNTGFFCSSSFRKFDIDTALLASLMADGVVNIQVANSILVSASCPVNRHTVRLRFSNQTPALEFGEVLPGTSETRTLRFENRGTADLIVSAVVSDDPQFTPNLSSLVVPRGATRTLDITFSPETTELRTGVLTIVSNDPAGTVTVDLIGGEIPVPDADLTPEALEFSLFSGQSEPAAAVLSNGGDGNLVYSVGLEATSVPGNGGSAKVAVHARAHTQKTSLACVPQTLGGGAPDFPCSQYETKADVGVGTDVYLVVANAPATGVTGLRCGISYDGLMSHGVDLIDWNFCATGLEFPSASWPEAGSGNTMTWGGCQIQEYPPNGVHAVAGVFYVYAYGTDAFSITEHMQLQSSPQATYTNCGGSETQLDPTELGSVQFSPGATFSGHNPCLTSGGVPAWLTVNPAAGSVPSGSAVNLQITADAGGLPGGLYQAEIRVQSNDPLNPVLTLPVDMAVEGGPNIELSLDSYDFGPNPLGGSFEKTIEVNNAGVDPLMVSIVVSDNPEFNSYPASFTVFPNTPQDFVLVYTPTTEGPVSGNLTFQSNDPAQASLLLPLTGEGVTPPAASLTNDDIVSNLYSGDVETQATTLENSGGSDLHYAMAFSGESPAVPGEPRVALHLQSRAFKGLPCDFAPTTPCSEYVTRGDVGTAYEMYVVVGNADSLGIAGILFGIDYDDGPGALYLVGWSLCSNGLEFPSSSWPAPVSGNIITWNAANCPRTDIPPNGVHAVAGSFYVYAYGSAEFSITPHKVLASGSRYEFADCSGTSRELPNDVGGTVAFSPGATLPGANPCLDETGTQPPPWLTIFPVSGSVPVGSSVDLEFTTDASGLDGGSYWTMVEILTNDPLAHTLPVWVALDVTDAARIAFDPESLEFGEVFLGAGTSTSITVHNRGNQVLSVSSVVPGLADYTVNPSTFDVNPEDSTSVEVVFSPQTEGDRSTDLVFHSNDPDSPHTVAMIGTGHVPPVLEAAPLSFEAAALPGGEKQKTLTVCNTGGNDLVYSVGDRPPSASSPDGYGHVWFDSDHPAGPVFNWVDVSAVGTPIFETEADDENAGPFPLGFDFPFYEKTFGEFHVCSNGWLSFTNTQSNFSNQALPTANSSVPENLLAALWDDLVFDPSISSSAFYHNDGSRLVVQFNDLRRFDEVNPPYYSFEILLYPNGNIVYQYLSVGNDGQSATVGIQNASRDDGLQVVHNAAYLHENLAVRFAVPTPWLSFSPEGGTVVPGSCENANVVMSAVGLAAGDYSGEFFVSSNDPFHPGLKGDVIFHVGSVEPDTSEISPGTLNSASHGKWISDNVELPAIYDPADVDLSTVRLQGVIPADIGFDAIGDFNLNGVPDRTFKFDRAAFVSALPENVNKVEVVVTGEIRDTIWFTARDSMRIVRPGLVSPAGGQTLLAGTMHEIRWNLPNGWDGVVANLYFTPDQTTWETVAEGVTGTSYLWEVPSLPTDAAGIKVEVVDEYGLLGVDASDTPFSISTQVTGVGTGGSIPEAYALLQNMPNPFSGSTTIRYDLPADSEVEVHIFDVAGRAVRRLVDGAMPAGRHQAVWDGRNDSGQRVASGIYFYRMKTPRNEDTKRLFILR